MDDDSRYQVVCSRDARFDGAFFFAVTTTGIYCRPSCPAVTPKRENVRFYRTAAAAHGSGFRACRRCRPDAVPGSAAWDARADTVGRAMRLIGDGVVDREGVEGLALRLGYSSRQLHRHLVAEVGVGPLALARAQRAHTARVLLHGSGLSMADVAFAAGFTSIRQFNETIRAVYATTPGALRASRRGASPRIARTGDRADIPLRLAYRPPLARRALFDFLAARAVPGVEEVIGVPGTRRYRRTLRLPHGTGVVEVGEAAPARPWLECRLHVREPRDVAVATSRVRRLFDLDADPTAVAERLSASTTLAPLVRRHPGLRSPGTPDPHELAVRAVLGQGLTPAAGRELGSALVTAYGVPLERSSGGLTHAFPTVAALAADDCAHLRCSPARRATLRALVTALADGSVALDPGADRDEAETRLLGVPGITPWTARYCRMRALHDPDVLPDGAEPGGPTGDGELWRPWRSYAQHHLWSASGDARQAG